MFASRALLQRQEAYPHLQLDASYLLVSSDRSTVHLFKLSDGVRTAANAPAEAAPAIEATPADGAQPATTAAPAAQQGWGEWLGGMAYTAGASLVTSTAALATAVLPTFMTEYFVQERSFLQFTLPKPELNHVCGLNGEGADTKIYVLSQDGVLCKLRRALLYFSSCVSLQRNSKSWWLRRVPRLKTCSASRSRDLPLRLHP